MAFRFVREPPERIVTEAVVICLGQMISVRFDYLVLHERSADIPPGAPSRTKLGDGATDTGDCNLCVIVYSAGGL